MPYAHTHPRNQPLHLQAEALRNALKTTLSRPSPAPLHHLRSTIRRIEALLQLLLDSADPRDSFLKATKPIRRSSGTLRDLDIQINLLSQLPTTDTIRPHLQKLTRYLKKKRVSQATKLQQILDKYHKKPLKILREFEPTVTPPRLQASKLARTLFTEATETLDPRDPAELHRIRKAARISRYIAESTPQGARSATAHHFHHIHQVTGAWHDWLTLTETATHQLPASSSLITTLERRRDQAHRAALRLLSTPRASKA